MKETYTQEEVEKLLFQYADEHNQLNTAEQVEKFDKWIQGHL